MEDYEKDEDGNYITDESQPTNDDDGTKVTLSNDDDFTTQSSPSKSNGKIATFEKDVIVSADDDERPSFASGCTAVVVLFDRINLKLYIANCGDSRSVLSRNGTAIDLSEDHKPEDLIEVTRINNAGGHVTDEGRINGCLNLSRALGDLRYKTNHTLRRKQKIKKTPSKFIYYFFGIFKLTFYFSLLLIF